MLNNQLNKMKERIISKFLEADEEMTEDFELNKYVYNEVKKYESKEDNQFKKLCYIMNNFNIPVKLEDEADNYNVIELSDSDDNDDGNDKMKDIILKKQNNNNIP